MMLGRGAEIPDIRIAVAREERVACELVAGPFADHGTCRVTDVVLIKRQQRTESRTGQRRAHTREAIVVQSAEIDTLLEIDLRVARSLDGPSPVVMWIDVVGVDDFGFLPRFFLRH